MHALRDRQYFGIVERMTNTDAVTALAALAQESRLAIFRLLVQNAPDGLTVGLIAEKLELPAPTLSFHLKTLSHAGLVRAAASGRHIRYTADFAAMRQLIDHLTENCCAADSAPACCSLAQPSTRESTPELP